MSSLNRRNEATLVNSRCLSEMLSSLYSSVSSFIKKWMIALGHENRILRASTTTSNPGLDPIKKPPCGEWFIYSYREDNQRTLQGHSCNRHAKCNIHKGKLKRLPYELFENSTIVVLTQTTLRGLKETSPTLREIQEDLGFYNLVSRAFNRESMLYKLINFHQLLCNTSTFDPNLPFQVLSQTQKLKNS